MLAQYFGNMAEYLICEGTVHIVMGPLCIEFVLSSIKSVADLKQRYTATATERHSKHTQLNQNSGKRKHV